MQHESPFRASNPTNEQTSHLCVREHMHTCVRVFACASVHFEFAHTGACTCVLKSARVHVSMRVRVRVNTCTRACVVCARATRVCVRVCVCGARARARARERVRACMHLRVCVRACERACVECGSADACRVSCVRVYADVCVSLRASTRTMSIIYER